MSKVVFPLFLHMGVVQTFSYFATFLAIHPMDIAVSDLHIYVYIVHCLLLLVYSKYPYG